MESRWMENGNPEGLYEAQLRALEQQLRDALLDGDHGAVAALLSPVLFMMDGQGGRILDLPWLQDWRQGHLQIRALQVHAVEAWRSALVDLESSLRWARAIFAPVERMARDARILTIGGGATEVMLEEVAKRM